MHPERRNARIFWPALFVVAALDVATKAAALRYLSPPYVPHEVFGDVARLTLSFNRGAAFGISVGSRLLISLASLIVVGFLFRLYRETPQGLRARVLALGLICGGAVGNLVDRARSGRGVVDFIDLGIGDVRFWTFNVADVAVTGGAILLGWAFLADQRDVKRRERRATRRA